MTDIKYTTVPQIDIKRAMASSSSALKAKGTLQRSEGTVWNQTVCIIMESVAITDSMRELEKLDETRAVLFDLMSEHIKSAMPIPEEGKDREGKTIALFNKYGDIKWSSWDETRRIFAYLGDIAKVITYGQESLLYPEERKVAARCDILKLCQVELTNAENIRRCAKDLQSYLDNTKSEPEILEAHQLTTALSVNNLEPLTEMLSLVNRLDALLSVVEDTDREQLRVHLLRCATKYFK
jgi:hypothetical protein